MQKVTTELLNKISDRIVNTIHPDKIVLFGSYAWGTPHTNSDVDLFVIVPFSNEPSYKRATSVYRCLRDITVPFDVIVQTRDELERTAGIPSSFTHKIMEEGKLLYG